MILAGGVARGGASDSDAASSLGFVPRLGMSAGASGEGSNGCKSTRVFTCCALSAAKSSLVRSSFEISGAVCKSLTSVFVLRAAIMLRTAQPHIAGMSG